MRAWSVMSVAAVALAAALAACDSGPSAVAPSSDRQAATESGRNTRTARAEPVPRIDGRPMWAANRRRSAQSNAAFQYRRNGGDFGAASQEDYVAAAHRFVHNPPAGTQVIERANGDRLLYDPRQNIFAVVTREGAPRTLFKPREGAAYFQREQERAAQRAARRTAQADDEEDRQAG